MLPWSIIDSVTCDYIQLSLQRPGSRSPMGWNTTPCPSYAWGFRLQKLILMKVQTVKNLESMSDLPLNDWEKFLEHDHITLFQVVKTHPSLGEVKYLTVHRPVYQPPKRGWYSLRTSRHTCHSVNDQFTSSFGTSPWHCAQKECGSLFIGVEGNSSRMLRCAILRILLIKI